MQLRKWFFRMSGSAERPSEIEEQRFDEDASLRMVEEGCPNL